MNILRASSEAAPFAKTGGLADVCGALPIALNRLGHVISVIMPAFRQVHQSGYDITPTDVKFEIPIGSKVVSGRLLHGLLPGSEVPVYFVEQDDYFDRPELYREHGADYKDNCERFVFFCRAVMDAIQQLKLPVDILHCNDWQTGLIPAYLKAEYAHAHGYENIATVMTIHNMAYQGQFWHWDMLLTGLDWKYFNWRQMEFHGDLNLLKTGIVFADAITTVSKKYAEEIQFAPLGCGLEGVLQQRQGAVFGIINGVDYEQWNPETDVHLPAKYSASNWQAGKAACKTARQNELGLDVSADTPVIGLVGRLAQQKGWDLVSEVMTRWVEATDAQWAILGTGEPQFHEALERLSAAHPGRVGANLEFSNALAHRIEAGADMFLMPSQYEPCGLNQLYSLKYGTIPVVRATGGLADSITDATPENLASKAANGFSFVSYDSASLEHALQRACDLYRNDQPVWQQLIDTAMNQDWSWDNSAREYVDMYRQTLQRNAASLEKLENPR